MIYFDPNALVGRWRLSFEDGKQGWLQVEPREKNGFMPGRMFLPNSVTDYPPGSKRTGRDYDHAISLYIVDNPPMGTRKFRMLHAVGGVSGQTMFHMGLVADGVLHGETNLCEDQGRIMQYPGDGYPFQFMGSGEFTAMR